MKTTRKSFLTSVVALILCFVMLMGTTFAWFTDSITSKGNKIVAGDLDIDLEMIDKNDKQTWVTITDVADPIFNYDKWEPGYTDVTILKVVNNGSLALKWQARFISNNAVSELAKVIDVYVKPGQSTYPVNKDDLSGWDNVGTLDEFINTLSTTTYGSLEKGESAYLGIALRMQEGAGNEYQDAVLGEFDIQIVAAQKSSESDSYGPEYDANAEWPEGKMNFETTQSLENVQIIHNELAEDVTIRDEATGVYAYVPAGVKIKEGITELKFSGKDLNGEDGNVSNESRSYDIHIEGIADDNEKSITVYIGAILEAGLSETSLRLFHEDALMTRVNSVADFATYDQFTYDEATGEVVLYVKNFSVFSAIENNTVSKMTASTVADKSWYSESKTEFVINDVADFLGFRDLVDEGKTFAGKTVKLNVDIDINGFNFDPIGYGYESVEKQRTFEGTFDGQNHTIYHIRQNGWEFGYSYGTMGGGLFAYVKNAIIKNLAICGANIAMECVDMGIVAGYAYGTCTFENIVVTNSKIANYNRYTGGVVGEVNGIHTFTNITVDSSVIISSLWGSFDTAIGGVIGGKYGNAKVSMTNVTVAAELDVFSDVTSAYQWYAYRRCGMLIGHTEESSKDTVSGTTFAAANFLTCTNVKVYYGEWVSYNYYEFNDQDSTTGQRYPWVRAEKGENNDAFSNPRYGVPKYNGVPVTAETAEKLQSNYVQIAFNQLYGGGQGVYGQAKHNNVTVSNKLTKTIYFENEWQWHSDSIKLYYWYAHGTNEWQNIEWPGETMQPVTGTADLYRYEVPAYAYGFVIHGEFGDNYEKVQTPDISVSKVMDKETLNPIIDSDKILTDNRDSMDIYFRNEWYWTDGTVKVHSWGSATDKDTSWPGVLMTKVGYDGNFNVYRITLKKDAKFLFNGYDNGSFKQSPDVTSGAYNGAVYYMHWDGKDRVDKLNE